MVQRQGGDDPFAVGGEWRADPGLRLVHVGQQVAVRQHGALGEAGGAAGVLQEGDVLRPDVDRPEHGFPALHDGLPEADGLGQIPGRDQPLQVFDDEIDRQPPVAQEVAEAGNDDGFDRGFVDDLRERVREVFQDDDDPCAAVGELELQFARFVERVAVDHGVAATQRTKDADRVLQDVGQHDGDAFAARQVEHVLQPGGEILRQRIEFAIAEFCAHAQKGGALTVVLHAFGEHRVQGRELVRVDVGRTPCFVVGQPDFFHDGFFLRKSCLAGAALAAMQRVSHAIAQSRPRPLLQEELRFSRLSYPQLIPSANFRRQTAARREPVGRGGCWRRRGSSR